jgi:hypothetical protein
MIHQLQPKKENANDDYRRISNSPPVTVAERSKTCTVFARSEAAIVGSNPKQGMDV